MPTPHPSPVETGSPSTLSALLYALTDYQLCAVAQRALGGVNAFGDEAAVPFPSAAEHALFLADPSKQLLLPVAAALRISLTQLASLLVSVLQPPPALAAAAPSLRPHATPESRQRVLCEFARRSGTHVPGRCPQGWACSLLSDAEKAEGAARLEAARARSKRTHDSFLRGIASPPRGGWAAAGVPETPSPGNFLRKRRGPWVPLWPPRAAGGADEYRRMAPMGADGETQPGGAGGVLFFDERMTQDAMPPAAGEKAAAAEAVVAAVAEEGAAAAAAAADAGAP